MFENVSKYIEHHIKEIGTTSRHARDALEEQKNKLVNTEFIVRFLQLILQNNIMEFNSQFYKQEIGAPMGSRPVPPYANVFMVQKIDPRILEIAEKYSNNGKIPISSINCFLYDLFSIWYGTTKDLHKFLNEINTIHPNIKFTLKHTSQEHPEDKCDCDQASSIPFLDTSLSIRNNKISVDLYRKPTDRNQYLLTNSIHPPECLKNIPYSLALRITKICTEEQEREDRYKELKDYLLERKYKSSLIDAVIRRARAIL